LDVKDNEHIYLNDKDICENSIDMLYFDIQNKNINIPTNDAVLVSLDLERLQSEKIINIIVEPEMYNGITPTRLTSESLDYIEVLEKYISRTLPVSTKPIYELIVKTEEG
jgi:hypothetical protein